jgi:putative ABC transport system permease protein
MQALRTMIPPTVPRADEIRLDGTVLVFGLFITIACGLFFGMAPAARGARTNLLPALTQSGRGVLGSSREFWRHGLVVAQTGFATALVIMAALLLQSLLRLQHVPLGFEPNGVITARLSAPQLKYPNAAATRAFHRTLLRSLESLPSVRAAGLMTSAPFAPGVRRGVPLRARAAGRGSSDTPTGAVEQVVSPALFEALGMKVMAGRGFVTQDQPGSPLVAVVSEGLARRLWAHGDAVGQILDVEGRSHEVVGVVGDIRGSEGTARGGGLNRDPGAVLYLPSAQFPQNTTSLVIRADTHLEAILPAIRAAVRQIDAAQPIPGLRPLDEWIAETMEQPRLTTTLAGAFAVAALLLTAVGIYGIISHSVTRRTQEIGVRMAIGAARISVVGLVLRAGMTWAGGGILLGLIAAWAASRAIAGLLFETSAADPLTFGFTAFVLAGVAALACMVPAIRATRIDPVIALRGE